MSSIKLLISSFEGAHAELLKGNDYIPGKKRAWKPETATRSAIEILNHVSYWNHFFARPLDGKANLQTPEDEWISSKSEMQTAEGAREAAEKASHLFLKALSTLSDKQLSDEVALPWGKASLQQVILSNYNHLSYHIGQLNYIQTLLGDGESH